MHVLTTTLISPQGRFAEGTPVSALPESLRAEAVALGCTNGGDIQEPEGTVEVSVPGSSAVPVVDGLQGLMSDHWRRVRERIRAGQLDGQIADALAFELGRDDGPRKSILLALEKRKG